MNADVTARIGMARPDGFELDVELRIPAGATTALLGPNGAGKSTTLAALAGLLAVQTGRITIGEDVVDDPAAGVFVPAARRAIGVVFQDRLLFPHLTLLENVAFASRSRGVAARPARRDAQDWLEHLGIGALADRRPADVSGGQAQRAALARALASKPRVLLLDEPLSALDVGARMSLQRVLRRHLVERPEPRLLVTHDPVEAFLLADRIAILENGRVTQTGTPDEIRLHPRTPYAADLVGVNLLTGTGSGNRVEVGGTMLQVARSDLAGNVLVAIHPRAIAIAREHPVGSQRNVWPTTVSLLEDLGDRVRLLTAGPLPLTVEITRESAAELQLAPGTPIWTAIKATEITVSEAADPDPGIEGAE